MAETNTTIQPVLLQIPTTVKSLVEALIFGAREPLSVRQVQALYEDQPVDGMEPRKIAYEEIARIVEELNVEYSAADRPFRIVQIAGGYQFATLPEYAEWLGKLYKEQSRRKLSQSSIETLAIIAYKQPITKPELEAIRGVNCDYVIKTLLEKDLATIVGRAPTVGRPLLYGTSNEFLRHFGLNDLNDLPRPREIQEILGESQFETERRMLEAQQSFEEKKEEDFKSRLPHIPKRKAGMDDDVKIVPRKRTREIKVRPTDESEVKSSEIAPEGTKEQEPVSAIPEMPLAPPIEDQTTALDRPVEAGQAALPAAENELRPDIPMADEAVAEDGTPLTVEQAKYVDLVQATSVELEEAIEPTQELEDLTSPDTIAPNFRPMEVTSAEEGEESIVESPVIEAAKEEQTAEIVAQAEVPSDVSTPAEQAPIGTEPIQAEAGEISPQSVSPTIEERPVTVSEAAPEMSESDIADQQNAPHPKTRWKSWKEKIQGFIKKLFG